MQFVVEVDLSECSAAIDYVTGLFNWFPPKVIISLTQSKVIYKTFWITNFNLEYLHAG